MGQNGEIWAHFRSNPIFIAPPPPSAAAQVERSGGPKLRLLKLRGLREEKLSPTQKGAFFAKPIVRPFLGAWFL